MEPNVTPQNPTEPHRSPLRPTEPHSPPLTLSLPQGSAVFDFSGSGPEVYGNCNAPRAITLSALIYCLRCMVGHDIPLNQVWPWDPPPKWTPPAGPLPSPPSGIHSMGSPQWDPTMGPPPHNPPP